jgi:polysaccharide biosynthesis transport protein
MQDQRELILSNRVMRRVASDCLPSLKPQELDRYTDKLRKKVGVTPPKGETFEGSNVFYVTFKDKDPNRAAEVGQSIVKNYLEVYQAIYKNKAERSRAFFEQQTQRLYEDVLAKEKELREYETTNALTLIDILNLEAGQAKTNIEVGPNALLTSSMRKYHEVQQDLAVIQVSIEALEMELQKAGIPVVPAEMEAEGRAISIFKNKLAQLQIELNAMSPQYGSGYIPMDQMKRELRLDVGSLRKELERTRDARKIAAKGIRAQLQEIERVIESLKEQIRSTAHEKSVYDHLRQEYALAKDAYTQTRSQLEQTRLATALNEEEQSLTLVDEPVPPYKPSGPNRLLIVALGLLGGVLFGIASALTLDFFDHTVRIPEDITTHLGVPYLGSLTSME